MKLKIVKSYFGTTNFSNLKTERIDKTVDFEWEREAPHSSMSEDGYSVRWQGKVEPRFSEERLN